MAHLYQKLRNVWVAAGVSVNEAATQEAIERFEEKRAMQLPPQFRAYLLTTNGMKDYEMDEAMISFHPLELIDSEWEWYEGEPADGLQNERDATRSGRHVKPGCEHDSVDIVFADYLINSHYYALRGTLDGEQVGVWCLDGVHSKCLAPSFDDFIAHYLVNPEEIAVPW